MKILLICEGFSNDSIKAQPWKHVYELAIRLSKFGNEVDILTDSGNDITNDQVQNINIISLKKGMFLFDNKELEKVLNENYDIINWNASGVLAALNTFRIKNKQPILWTLHAGIITFRDLRNLKIADIKTIVQFWNNFLYSLVTPFIIKKLVNRKNNNIITLSYKLKKSLMRMGVNEEYIHVVPSGVDPNIFMPLSDAEKKVIRSKLGYTLNEKIILYYGPLNPYRVDELVYSISDIIKKHSMAHFIFLSRTLKRDERSQHLKQIINHEDRSDIIEGILGFNEIIQYLNIADMVVLPFRFWPFIECPLTVLETMSVGTPLITTNVISIPELIDDGKSAILVKPKSDEIKNAIEYLISNQDVADVMSLYSRNHIINNFTWDISFQKTWNIFKTVHNSYRDSKEE